MTVSSDISDLFKSQVRWRFINELLATDPEAALLRDVELLKEVASGKRCATARLWENPQCLVVTRKETKFPNFESARSQLAAEGWPVIIRDSGGTTVPHRPGILNFTLFFPVAEGGKYDLDLVYMALCEPIRLALRELGLCAEYGETKGSYCDGRYNLNVEGLKVTGTAQKIMISPPNTRNVKQAVMAQAMLMVDTDAEDGTYWVNRFYSLAGNARQFDPSVSSSIRDFVGMGSNGGDLTECLRAHLQKAFNELIS
ncbi:MAG: lipoate--protein ligase family protein [Neptuniibacter sp.]